MSVNPVNMSPSAVGFGGGAEGGSTRIKALEQKLQKLKEDKQKAVQEKDADKEKKLEKEIQKVEQQIEQLKRKEKNKQKEGEKSGEKDQRQGNGNRGYGPEDLLKGQYMDRNA